MAVRSISITRTAARDGFAGSARLVVRMCLSVGPRAVILTRETRKVGARTKAVATTIDPLGVDLTQVYPYECVERYSMSWLVQSRFLVGGGTYSLNVRVRDGHGRMSKPALAITLRL